MNLLNYDTEFYKSISFVKRGYDKKIHESKTFEDFSYNACKQNAILINSRNLRHEEAKTIIFRRWVSEAVS